jgi:predicted transcriptional regulator
MRGPDRPVGGGGARPVRRREQSDLFATILEVVKRHRGDARITRVSYGAGMPVDRLKVAVDRLMALGLLERIPRDAGSATYEVTARGQEFLNTYWKMRGFIEAFESPDLPPP